MLEQSEWGGNFVLDQPYFNLIKHALRVKDAMKYTHISYVCQKTRMSDRGGRALNTKCVRTQKIARYLIAGVLFFTAIELFFFAIELFFFGI